jgi:hypothetical protein
MLFKKKVSIAEYCGAYLNKLFSIDWDGDLERLRDACNDPALSGIEKALFHDHLKAIVIQLLLIAIAKNCDPEISSDARIYAETYLKHHNGLHIYEIGRKYVAAFDSAHVDGIGGVVGFFSSHLADSNLRKTTVTHLETEFHKEYNAHVEAFKGFRLTP